MVSAQEKAQCRVMKLTIKVQRNFITTHGWKNFQLQAQLKNEKKQWAIVNICTNCGQHSYNLHQIFNKISARSVASTPHAEDYSAHGCHMII
ncbi:hypothetical protein PR048_020547 [Dryococelus australis]|uniref:Uncharacterized protein n=1 Tax=Dryococelus australis TaxID=614101 RepID=A0ABQ9H6M4_9NEOP|nr:hypothetical protein PR048_020547 [Dryococelus australis]